MPPGTGSILRGWREQGRNIRALVLRDMVMRYGRDNIGFVWTIVEPMLLCLGVMVIWSLMGGYKNGMKVVEVVLTGYMPLTLWRHTTNTSIRLFRGSAPLLYHRRVTLLDILAARMVLEFIATTAALMIIWGGLYVAGIVRPIARMDLFLLGWCMMAWFSFAASAIFASITEASEAFERFVPPIQYLNIPLSGCFFLLEWMPGWARNLILIHPHAHCYEVFRSGYFGDSIQAYFSMPYFVAVAFVTTVIGVLAVAHVRDRVQLN